MICHPLWVSIILWLPTKTTEHDPSAGADREETKAGYTGKQCGSRTDSHMGGWGRYIFLPKKLFLSSWWELHGTIKYDSRWVRSCDTLIWGNGTSEQVRKYLGSWTFFLVKSMSLQRFLFDRNTWGLNEFLSNLFKTKRVFCLHTFDNPRPNLLMTWNNGLEIPVLQ